MVWAHRATTGAAHLLPPPLEGGPWVPVTIGALNHYHESPVGPYSEIVALPGLLLRPLPCPHVAFIAVDEPGSVTGGRANWALPKVLGRFSGPPGRAPEVAAGPGWTVRARARPWGPSVPMWAPLSCCQVGPGRQVLHFPVRAKGRLRVASVDVEVSSSGSLATWLTPGRHPGFVFRGRAWFGAPRP